MTNEQQTESSPDLLNQVVRLLGILVLRGIPEGSSQADKILLLHIAGLSHHTIADLTGASLKTVGNRISESKSGHQSEPHRRKAANAREQ